MVKTIGFYHISSNPKRETTTNNNNNNNFRYQTTNVWENQRLMKFSPNRSIEGRSLQRPKVEEEDYHHFALSRSANKINQMGGLVEPGAHGQRQGLAFHWELWMFSQVLIHIIPKHKQTKQQQQKQNIGWYDEL